MKKAKVIFLKYSSLIILSPLLLASISAIDPTRPPGYQEPEGHLISNQPLHLSAIFIHPGYRLAIINSTPLQQGDKISEYTVTSINSNAVELVDLNGKQEVLQLTVSVKQPVG